MKLSDFLRDKWISAAAALVTAAFSCLLLLALGAGGYAAGFVPALILLGGAAGLAAEYIPKKRFYRETMESLDRLDKKFLLSEVVKEPGFLEGKILCEVEKQTEKAMNDEIAGYRRESREYREYIESWVHEIKTPISACRLILENNPGKLSQSLEQDFARIGNYVDQVLFYARSGGVEKDYVLKKITLKELMGSALKKNVSLLIGSGVKVEASDLERAVFADVKWMDFIIGQILINSVQYRRENPSVSFSGIAGPNSVTLVIEDNGIGIPRRDLGRVFEKGFTGANGRLLGKSTGLGLYLCKRLCDKLNLGISIASIEGSGTAVSLVFPVGGMYALAARTGSSVGPDLTKT